MFEHKLYFPNISHALRDEVRDILIDDHGGFTTYHATGYWDMMEDGVMTKTSEPVIVFEVIATGEQMPRGFALAKKKLLEMGEECVLTTTKPTNAEFHYE